ncbi:hypothetical protein VKT23_019989 [Stygiomarasmius scandens]|uniref:Uncharacterized protein n=1 Tax=Marasmiellus scandens TaxID=2682957 RepID=A0ABR1IMR2_9AGAR
MPFHWDEHTSLSSKSYWVTSTLPNLIHVTDHQRIFPSTFPGGKQNSNYPYQDPYQAQQNSKTCMPTLMPAEALASAYTSRAIGEHTGLSQDGKEKRREILVGLKPLASGSSRTSLHNTVHKATTTKSMETMKVSLKGGGTDAAETDPQTIFSSAYMSSLKKVESSYTSPQTTTPPTDHLEANMALQTSSYLQSPSLGQPNSNPSSLTLMPHSPQPNSVQDILSKALLTHLTLVNENAQPNTLHPKNTLNEKQNSSPHSPSTGQSDSIQTKTKWPSEHCVHHFKTPTLPTTPIPTTFHAMTTLPRQRPSNSLETKCKKSVPRPSGPTNRGI